MTDYGRYRASLIKAELERRGEKAHELGHAVGAQSSRTGERWVSTGRIQHQYRKPVADYLGIPFDTLFPEFVREEELQLDRIEAELSAIRTILSELATQLRDSLRTLEPKTGTAASKSRNRRAK